MDQAQQPVGPAPWLFWIAIATVIAALPLLSLGALVTSMGVGMADSRSVVSPIQAIVEFATGDRNLGWKIEHSHRLAGWIIGLLGLLLAVVSWWKEPRAVGKTLATLAFVLIGVQGLLGIFRVRLNAWWGPELAWIHGCFAQIVFAVLVSVAYIDSPAWLHFGQGPSGPRLRLWSIGCVAIVFAQLVLGGMIRHMQNLAIAQLHLINAFMVMAAVIWLIKLALDEKQGVRGALLLLIGLLAVQVLLGVAAFMPWMKRFLDPALANQESLAILTVRSLHYLLGTLLFANLVVIALKAHRGITIAVAAPVPSAGRLEGTA